MKKFSLIFMAVLLIFCSGCSNKSQEVVIPEQPFLMESTNAGSESFVITINYLYQGSRPQFEFVDVKETGLGAYDWSCEDITTEQCNGEYRGYRIGVVCIELVPEETNPVRTAKVESITLKVNDAEREIIFKEPLELIPLSSEANCGKISLAQLSVGAGVGGDVTFAFEAMEDVTLESVSLGKYAKLENMTVSIAEGSETETEQIGGPECLPLMVEKGDVFVVRGTVKTDYFTGYQDIDTVSTVRYSVDGESYIEQHNLFLGAIDDMEDVEFCIDALFDRGILK